MEHYIEKRRDTTLIRISKEWHRQIKMKTAREGVTLSKALDQICKSYFEKSQSDHRDDDMLADYAASLHR